MLSWLKSLCLIAGALSLSACGSFVNSGSGSNFSPVTESTYCGTSSSVTNPVTITATAEFRKRTDGGSGFTLDSVSANLPIRHAEVHVLNSAGQIIQCSETSASGVVNLQIPKTAGTYTLKVNSRADNTNYKVSVLNNPSSNTPFSISASFSVVGNETGSIAVSLPLAAHNGDVKGGAFNILDQVLVANTRLRSQVTGFTVVPKVRIYWTAGLSPGVYAFGDATEPISFFSDSDSYSRGMLAGIYMLGGISGDVNCTDTDHFDDSVILHEYGHFLEFIYAGSDSPGGAHDGNRLIDARLAWSEGFANFIQANFLNTSRYVDTIGNSDCGSGSPFIGVNLDLEMPQSGQDRMLGGTPAGQGVFREVSVSRTLLDLVQSSGASTDSRAANLGLEPIWEVFSSPPPVGISGTNIRFRNFGLFNKLLYQFVDDNMAPQFLTDTRSVLENEYQVPGTAYVTPLNFEYGLVVTPQVSDCPVQIKGTTLVYGGATNFLENEDFFAYYYDGTSTNATIRLEYSVATSGTPDDLDLYIYNETHNFGNANTIASSSARFYPESGSTGLEIASLAGKAAGWYLINVSVDSDNLGARAEYDLRTNSGNYLCPAP